MPKKGTRRKWFLRGLLCGVVLLLALFFGGIAYMRYEAERLIVNRLEVRSDEWTLPPLKVAVAADFHVARDPDDMARLRRIVERTNAEKPDLILLPGDFAAGLRPGQSAEPQEIADELAKLQAPLGVYAVLGNHDHWQGKENFIRAFEKAGIPLLENRSLDTLRKEMP